MDIINKIGTVVFSFGLMEGVAWLAHKYVMHGILWELHKDHHQPTSKSMVERNDTFFLIFAIPAIFCFLIGYSDLSLLFWAGIGITLYGLAYFFVHDLFIHQRLKIFRNVNSFYFRAIRKAHKVHHKHLERHNGECFGMLWAPPKYFRKTKKNAD